MSRVSNKERILNSRLCCIQLFLVLGITASSMLTAPQAAATDPEAICDNRDVLVSMLVGKPHFERQALVLKDEMPLQGHRLELFMNSGEGGRHSYSLIRVRGGEEIACILTAGLVAGKTKDAQGQAHITLNDENDADIFEIVICPSHYVITRAASTDNVCENTEKRAEAGRLIASYGRIITDNRAAIPWPAN